MQEHLFKEETWLLCHLKMISFHYLKCPNIKNQKMRNKLNKLYKFQNKLLDMNEEEKI